MATQVAAVWPEYAAAVKRTGHGVPSELVARAVSCTNASTVKFACIKWTKQALPPAVLHTASSSSGLRDTLASLHALLVPLRVVCQSVDSAIASSSSPSCEQSLLVHFQDRFLTRAVLEELAQWARADISAASSTSVSEDHHHHMDIVNNNTAAGERAEVAMLLRDLGWLADVEDCLVEACYEAVRDHVQQECSMRFTDSLMLDSMLVWLHSTILPWHANMFPSSSQRRIEFYLYQQFGLTRSREVFEIITTYPDSAPAVDDLKQCLLHTRQTKELAAMCCDALDKRLLHVGTNTSLILLVYIRLIKTMMRLDARGILLDACSHNIKHYLRSRPETIKCVVQALTNEDDVSANSDLAEELGAMTQQQQQQPELEEEEADGDDVIEARSSPWWDLPAPRVTAAAAAAAAWEPDPIEAKTSISQLKSSVDVLGNLVRVYGSKELFVSEYRLATSDRLLRSSAIDLEQEIARLEMLKLRFGETLLLPVDVMVRDIADSKRANTAIRHAFVDTLVLSRLYWPQFTGAASSSTSTTSTDADFTLHPRARVALAEYAHKYAVLKKPRRVQWQAAYGAVELDLEFEDGSQLACASVTPMQCSVILHFQDQPRWTVQDLAREMGVADVDVMRRRLHFWLGEGVLVERERGVVYEIVKQAPVRRSTGEGGEEEDDDWVDDEEGEEGGGGGGLMEGDGGEEEEGYDQEEVDDSHFAFVSTMLTNLGELPLETIHKNLQLFSAALPMGYDRTEDDLQQLLDACVAKGTLELGKSGKFQLPSDG